MIALAATPLIIGLLLRLGAGSLARRLRPHLAVPLLTALALTVALCTGLVLSAFAMLACAQLGPVARFGHWSAPVLHAHADLPDAVGFAALLVVSACAASAILRLGRSTCALLHARGLAKTLQPVSGNLVVVEDEVPTAYAVPGAGSRIVVSTSMLAALSAAERRVLIAHETAHLRHRHHLYLHCARLAAAANPLLRSTADLVAAGIERWADEAAAAEVGDRALTARALAQAALAHSRASRPVPSRPVALAAAEDHVVERVSQLLAPRPAQQRAPVLLVVLAGALSWVAAATITVWANNVVQVAEAFYPR